MFSRKSHNCAGTAFVQGVSVGGSKLIEQTLRKGYTVYDKSNKKISDKLAILTCPDVYHGCTVCVP